MTPAVHAGNGGNMIAIREDTFERMSRFVRDAFGISAPGACSPVTGGLINDTFDVGGRYILQRVSPIFGAEVNTDIASLVPVLSSGGVRVPSLYRAVTGAWWADGESFGFERGVWRLMTRLAGGTLHQVENMAQIRSLTLMMAKFHGALDGCGHVFAHTRPGVHDISRHLQAFERALAEHHEHRLYREVSALAERLEGIRRYVDLDSVMQCEDLRIIHGDPKISNWMFEGDEVVGVVDLDTMARSRVSFDVGDAVRSWCNPSKEDAEPSFNAEYAREVQGLYQEAGSFLTSSERRSLGASAIWITLELSMRFGRDALCEDYFGYDPEIGHGEHSLKRAESMYALACQMLSGREV